MVGCFTEKKTVLAGTEKRNTALQTLMNDKLNSFKDLGPLKNSRHDHIAQVMAYRQNRLDKPVFIGVPKPMLRLALIIDWRVVLR